MTIWTAAAIGLWMVAIDQHWPDATSPVTVVIILIFAFEEILRSRT